MMISDSLFSAGAQVPSTSVPASVSSIHSLTPLGDSSLPYTFWSSLPGQAGTSFLSWLQSLPHDKHSRFMPLACVGLISVYQLCRKGTNSNVLATQAALAECYGQWSSFVVLNNLAMCSNINAICHAIQCSQKCKSWQKYLPPSYNK